MRGKQISTWYHNVSVYSSIASLLLTHTYTQVYWMLEVYDKLCTVQWSVRSFYCSWWNDKKQLSRRYFLTLHIVASRCRCCTGNTWARSGPTLTGCDLQGSRAATLLWAFFSPQSYPESFFLGCCLPGLKFWIFPGWYREAEASCVTSAAKAFWTFGAYSYPINLIYFLTTAALACFSLH